jgi:AraC-like DNA-binding protein
VGTLIRATNMWGYRDLVLRLGADPEAIQRRFGITPGAEHVEEAFLPFDAFVRMLETTAHELDCPDFGLRLSQWQGLDILGPIAVIARNAETVEQGLQAVARYLYVHSPALRLDRGPDTASGLTFTYEVVELSLAELGQGYELSMANAVRIIQLLAGPEARPRAISFLHAQQGPDAGYADALGCPVRFGQPWCGFELSHRVARTRIDHADPETRRVATRYLESQYPPSETSLRQRVGELARRLLPTGQCSVDAIADQLRTHPRTLQRQLAADGVTCQDLIDTERRELASRYLAEPRLQLGQISGLLGYAEQSTFNRSCRRWFGATPGEYREQLAR